MNKPREDILDTALANLRRTTGIEGAWQANTHLDGIVELELPQSHLSFKIDIKKELRAHQLQQIEYVAQKFPPYLLVAQRLFPKIKESLRQLGIAYLEANGNIFIHQGDIWLWIDANKPLKAPTAKSNRAFTKTGLKVLFQLLLDKELINETQREIARQAGVALGNIPRVIDGLLETGYLVRKDKNNFAFMDRKALLEKWVVAYEDTLKPSLVVGRYRWEPKGEQDPEAWKQLPLDYGQTQWGGEAAGDLLTQYLRPEVLTLYTSERRNALMTKYRLVPDEQGAIRVFRRFWEPEGPAQPTVPPLLVYVDLMNTHDKRCQEAAEIIFNEYVEAIL